MLIHLLESLIISNGRQNKSTDCAVVYVFIELRIESDESHVSKLKNTKRKKSCQNNQNVNTY